MSHSTQVGFSAPEVSETTIESINCFPFAKRLAIAGDDRFPRSRSSFAEGVGQSRTAIPRGIPAPFPFLEERFRRSLRTSHVSGFSESLKRLADGVGHNPNSVASVRGTNGGSWYAMPFRIKPERGQVSENRVNPSTKQC